MRDTATRHALDEARAKVRELLRPEREAEKIKRAQQRKGRQKAIGAPSAGQRDPRQRDTAYLAWIRKQPCVGCLVTPGFLNTRHIEAAHVKCGFPGLPGWRPFGVQEKSHDWRAVPLCADHHRVGPKAQHNANERVWWASLGIYPPTLCAALLAARETGADVRLAILNTVERREP